MSNTANTEIKIGDRVRIWTGKTGTVIAIERRLTYTNDQPVYYTIQIVQPDREIGQRKADPPVRWDAIDRIEVIA